MPVVLVVGMLALAGCDRGGPPAGSPGASAKALPVVYVANYPLDYFARRIGGDAVTVVFPMTESGDPAFWQPSLEVITAYQKADLILLNGANYSGWVNKVALPGSRTVDTSAAFATAFITSGETVTHNHGPQGAHSHAALAFTTWLDPQLALKQAAQVAAALTRLRPDKATGIQQRLAELKTDWNALDAELKASTAAHRGEVVIASHPVYQYLERAAGLNLHSLHWEPDAEPDTRQWEDLRSLLASQPAHWMIWEEEPLPAVRTRLETEFGLRCVVFNPCGNRPAEGDLLEAMRANVRALAEVYAGPAQ
jgi:zinc transport system substrate-binding protein